MCIRDSCLMYPTTSFLEQASQKFPADIIQDSEKHGVEMKAQVSIYSAVQISGLGSVQYIILPSGGFYGSLKLLNLKDTSQVYPNYLHKYKSLYLYLNMLHIHFQIIFRMEPLHIEYWDYITQK